MPFPLVQPYRVTSGPYRLKYFRPDAMNFRFEPNPDYYRGGDPHIDWLTVRRFTLPANAVKAIENGALDLLFFPFYAMQSLYQFPTTVPCQQWPFFEDNYYALFLNRHHGPYRTNRTVDCLKVQLIIGQSTSICAWDRLLKKKISHRFLDPPLTFGLLARVACFAIWLISSEGQQVLLWEILSLLKERCEKRRMPF